MRVSDVPQMVAIAAFIWSGIRQTTDPQLQAALFCLASIVLGAWISNTAYVVRGSEKRPITRDGADERKSDSEAHT